MNKQELKKILKQHVLWLQNNSKGLSANLRNANLENADLKCANLENANLRCANLENANLRYANLRYADLRYANLRYADLENANLRYANLRYANLENADLRYADLENADLRYANLRYANLENADLRYANLRYADLRYANLRYANLENAKGLVKLIGVEVGNYYWKRFNVGLKNNDYQFKIGLNKLRKNEVFASDERAFYSYPGFHFASKSWCALNYSNRPLEAKIRIPKGAKINEPWATDGKASSDKIEIIQVFDTGTGKDVTDKYR